MIVAEGSSEAWHGAGVLSWPDGRRYIGQFCHGVFEGEATMTWPDGRRYIGQYRQNKKHGEGDFLWRDGRRYSGQWSDGVRHGHGVYTNARGEKRAGIFAQDRPISWIGAVYTESEEDASQDRGKLSTMEASLQNQSKMEPPAETAESQPPPLNGHEQHQQPAAP